VNATLKAWRVIAATALLVLLAVALVTGRRRP
jgi:hypothetical protein